MKIVTMNIDLKGIYGWGKGWLNEDVRRKWFSFWNGNLDTTFWKHFECDGNTLDQKDYLVSTTGSVYLHPMTCNVMTKELVKCEEINADGTRTEVFADIDELKDIFKKCAEFCGASVAFNQFKVHEI